MGNSVSYSGVGGVGTLSTASGSGTVLSSGSITVSTGQIALCAYGTGNTGSAAVVAHSGGTNRSNGAQSTFVSLLISDSTSTATFTASTSPNSNLWSSIAVVLIPPVTVSLTGRGALTATAAKFGATGNGTLTATAVATKFTLSAHLTGNGTLSHPAWPANNPLFFVLNHLQNNQSSNTQILGDSISYGYSDAQVSGPWFHGWVGRFGVLLGQYYNQNVSIQSWNDQSTIAGTGLPDAGDSGQFYDAPYSLHASTSGSAGTLLMSDGGSCSQELLYLNDATRLPIMLSTPNLDVIILATGINDWDVDSDTTTTYVSRFESWLTNIQALAPGVPIIVTNENATNSTNDTHFVALFTALWTALSGQPATYCGVAANWPGVYMLDTRSMYTNLTTMVDPSNSLGGVHPEAPGYLAQAKGMLQTLAPGVTWPGQPHGQGVLSASVRSTTVPVAGHGALTCTALVKAFSSPNPVSHGVLAAVAGGVIPLAGHGTLSCTAAATKFILAAHPGGLGTLSGIFRPKFTVTASLAGNGLLLGGHGNLALLTGNGALAAPIKVKVNSTIAGQGALAVMVQPNEKPTLPGLGTLTATTLPIRAIAVSVTGTGQLTLTAGVFTTAVPSGSGALTATAHAKKFILAAALAGHGVLQTKQFLGVNPAGQGALTCTAINIGATVLFDAAGDGYTSTGTSAAQWFHPATPGAGVVVVVFSQPNPSAVHYGNTMMTEIGRVTVSDGFGYLTFYGLLNVAGSDTVSVTWGIPARDVVANSVSYNGPNVISGPQGISNQYGYISTQPEITCPGKSAIVHAFAGVATESGGYNFANYTGGTSRWSFPLDEITTGPTTAICLIGDSVTTTAFTATLNTRQRHAYVWASYTLTLRLVI